MTGLARLGFNAFHLPLLDDQCVHPGFEVHLTATFDNRMTHVLYHPWQFIRTDVRMGVHQDGGGSPVLAKYVQYLVHVSPLFAPGI